VLAAAWKTVDGEWNVNGVSLALTLARYFKREFGIEDLLRSRC
jgi:glycosylphosphatidylinositol transamidase